MSRPKHQRTAESAENLELLRLLQKRPIPPEFAQRPPHPDIWAGGYAMHSRSLPVSGEAYWGRVHLHNVWRDPEGPDVSWGISWLDAQGALHSDGGFESSDAVHAALSRGKGEPVLSMDAALHLGKELVILQDPHCPEHAIPFESLCAVVDPSKQPQPEAAPDADPAIAEAESEERPLFDRDGTFALGEPAMATLTHHGGRRSTVRGPHGALMYANHRWPAARLGADR